MHACLPKPLKIRCWRRGSRFTTFPHDYLGYAASNSSSLFRFKPTTTSRIDAILQGVVGIFETEFPDRVRGYYVTRSYADNSAILSSDIDGFILFK